jgi:hypothetical protein
MNLVSIGNLVINLDNVSHWVVRPKEQGSTLVAQPSNEPVITIHFVGNMETVSLFPPTAAAFLSFLAANVAVKVVPL